MRKGKEIILKKNFHVPNVKESAGKFTALPLENPNSQKSKAKFSSLAIGEYPAKYPEYLAFRSNL